jgi:hypothetical protein
VIVPDFVPAEGVKIAVTEAEAKEQVSVALFAVTVTV